MTKAERLGLESESMSDDPKHESPADFVVLHSIGISLKRIADTLDRVTGRYMSGEFYIRTRS